MQIDLFKENRILTNCARTSKKIETRKFKLVEKLDGLSAVISDDFVKNAYKAKLQHLLKDGRTYKQIGNSSCDSLFELETLGIAEYCKRYTTVLDFSYSLDYALHRLCGCNMRDIRAMENYNTISNSLLNFQFDGIETLCFNQFIGISAELDQYLINLTAEAEEHCANSGEYLSWAVFTFYNQVLSIIARTKDYALLAVIDAQIFERPVYRSKSFAAALASSNTKIIDELVLKLNGFEDYRLLINSYAPFEYLEGRKLRLEFNW